MKSARSFLVYWRRDQIEAAVSDVVLDHAASDQFGLIQQGDALWISGPGKTNRLVTIGPIHVDNIVGQKEAERRLGSKLWSAKHHALCHAGQAVIAREVSLDSVIEQLTFVSSRSPVLDSNKPIGQQLQRIRKLTLDSAAILEEAWKKGVQSAVAEFDILQRSIADFDELEEKRQVAVRKEQAFLRESLFLGSRHGVCAICGARLIVELLVAAHIKPRAKCSDEERRDLANIVPMCALGCDALFERGFLGVTDGKIIFRLPREPGLKLERLMQSLQNRRCAAWKPERQKYFNWHYAKCVCGGT